MDALKTLVLKKNKDLIPTENWENVGKVTELFLYPLKNGHHLEVKSFSIDCFGPYIKTVDGFIFRDRCLVVYDEKTFVQQTIQMHHKLLFIKITYDSKRRTIGIEAPKVLDLQLKVEDIVKINARIKIRGSSPENYFSLDCGEEAATWVSNFLIGTSSGLRIGFIDPNLKVIQDVHPIYVNKFPIIKPSSCGILADYASILLNNESPRDDVSLLTRTSDDSSVMMNFKSNVVIDGPSMPCFIEDNYKWIKIGNAVFHITASCLRCLLTTEKKQQNGTPIKALKKYRKMSHIIGEIQDPKMGRFLYVIQEGKINVGDAVYVQ